MPLYEYECQECGQKIEVLQRFGEAPKATCDQCGGELKKLLSAPMVQFKGSGWYVTDYGAKKPAASRSKNQGSSGERSKDKSEPKSASPKPSSSKADTSGAKSD